MAVQHRSAESCSDKVLNSRCCNGSLECDLHSHRTIVYSIDLPPLWSTEIL